MGSFENTSVTGGEKGSGAAGEKARQLAEAAALGVALAAGSVPAEAGPSAPEAPAKEMKKLDEQGVEKKMIFSGSAEHPAFGKVNIEIMEAPGTDEEDGRRADRFTIRINGEEKPASGVLPMRAKGAPAFNYMVPGRQSGTIDTIRVHMGKGTYMTRDAAGNAVEVPLQ